jgi:hypothetical protein
LSQIVYSTCYISAISSICADLFLHFRKAKKSSTDAQFHTRILQFATGNSQYTMHSANTNFRLHDIPSQALLFPPEHLPSSSTRVKAHIEPSALIKASTTLTGTLQSRR